MAFEDTGQVSSQPLPGGIGNGNLVPVYHLPCESVLNQLNVNPRQGLSADQVLQHRELYGSNALPVEKGKPWWKILLSNIFNVITFILLGMFCVMIELYKIGPVI